jgi:hypothetical protein
LPGLGAGKSPDERFRQQGPDLSDRSDTAVFINFNVIYSGQKNTSPSSCPNLSLLSTKSILLP